MPAAVLTLPTRLSRFLAGKAAQRWRFAPAAWLGDFVLSNVEFGRETAKMSRAMIGREYRVL